MTMMPQPFLTGPDSPAEHTQTAEHLKHISSCLPVEVRPLPLLVQREEEESTLRVRSGRYDAVSCGHQQGALMTLTESEVGQEVRKQSPALCPLRIGRQHLKVKVKVKEQGQTHTHTNLTSLKGDHIDLKN